MIEQHTSSSAIGVGVALSESIRKTLTNTFITVGVMLALTAIAAYLSVGVTVSLLGTVLAFVVSIGLIFAVHALRNSAWGLVVLGIFSLIMGFMLAPSISHHLALPNGTMLVANAAGLTAVATFACAVYAITSKRDFSRIRAFLFASTVVLLIAMIVAMFVPIPGLHMALSAIGVVLFTAWLLHDLGAIVNGQQTNYITASIGVYLDIINIFSNLLRLMGLMPGKSD